MTSASWSISSTRWQNLFRSSPRPSWAEMAEETAPPAPGASTVSRRGLLGLAVGAGAAGLAIGAGAGAAAGAAAGRAQAEATASVHPFFGAHQAGITTAVQDHLHFASFDMMERTGRD